MCALGSMAKGAHLVKHHLAYGRVGLALLHVEHIAQGHQAQGLVVW